MGFRTVVMLNNDRHNEWSNDPELGQKISMAMNSGGEFRGGKVVECVHADNVTLVKLGFYDRCELMSNTYWDDKSPDVTLLKQLADKLGYRVVKKNGVD